MVLIPTTANSQRINPYWKLALVFKCLSDNIVLDNFQSVLQQLKDLKVEGAATSLHNEFGIFPNGIDLDSRAGTGDTRDPPLFLGPTYPLPEQDTALSVDSDRGRQTGHYVL